MSLASRISRALHAFRTAPNMDQLKVDLDKIARHEEDLPQEAKELDNISQLAVRSNTVNLAYYQAYGYLRSWVNTAKDKIPMYGSVDRDEYLSVFWHREPILAGAIYSMSAKMSSLGWTVTGRRLVAKNAAQIFASAAHMDGYDWGSFMSATAQDFYTTDRGVFWELARADSGFGPTVTRLAGGIS